MLNDGVYKYYSLDDSGARTYKGAIKILQGQLSIALDPAGIMSSMFQQGPVTPRVEDTMRAVNRNHYAIFIKSEQKKKAPKPQVAAPAQEVEKPVIPAGVKSVYETLGDDAESVEKGELANKIKSGMAGLVMAATAMAPGNMNSAQSPQESPQIEQAQSAQAKPVKPVNHRKERILSSIMDVESSGGKNTDHQAMPKESLHRGEAAWGSYGLMPLIIRETIKKNPHLKEHAAAQNLIGDRMHEYMRKNPKLEKQIADAHYDRLAKQFGDNPDKIGYAWLNGVVGTWKAIKEQRPLKEHQYVKKILKAYAEHKKNAK